MSAGRALLLASAGLLASAVPAAAADERVIAAGVSAGGIDLSGLTVDAATAQLEAVLAPRLAGDVVLEVGGRTYRLTAAQAKLRFDARRTAQRAAHVVAAPPSGGSAGGGASAGTVIPLALSHARLAVRAWVAGLAARVRRAPRDAGLKVTLARVALRRAVLGVELDRKATEAAVDAAFADGTAPREIRLAVKRVRPAVNADDLRRAAAGTVVTVDRSKFVLRLFKGSRLVKRYRIAVGMAGLDTPAGRYRIQSRQVNPAWHVPRSAWAGSLQGQVIPGGTPQNPLKARWLGIANGVGIHGTGEEWSIGSRASHGCIRMRVADVIDLYPRVPVGAAVLIV